MPSRGALLRDAPHFESGHVARSAGSLLTPTLKASPSVHPPRHSNKKLSHTHRLTWLGNMSAVPLTCCSVRPGVSLAIPSPSGRHLGSSAHLRGALSYRAQAQRGAATSRCGHTRGPWSLASQLHARETPGGCCWMGRR